MRWVVILLHAWRNPVADDKRLLNKAQYNVKNMQIEKDVINASEIYIISHIVRKPSKFAHGKYAKTAKG